MEPPLPESNTAPTKQPRVNTHVLLEALAWVRAGVNVYVSLTGHDSAASAIETITKAAVRLLLHES